MILHIGGKCCLIVENTFTPTTEFHGDVYTDIYTAVYFATGLKRIRKVINSGVGKALQSPFLDPENILKKSV